MKFNLHIFNDTKVEKLDNRAILSGVIASEIVFNHAFAGNVYYKATLDVKRLSGVIDKINIIIKDVILRKEGIQTGCHITVAGCIRSHTQFLDNGQKKSELFLNVLQILAVTHDNEPQDVDINVVNTKAILIKKSEIRKTLNGKYICDIIAKVPHDIMQSSSIKSVLMQNSLIKDTSAKDTLAKETSVKDDLSNEDSEQTHSKIRYSYIPCILWGTLAVDIQKMPISSHLNVVGRMQSRNYIKNVNGEKITKITYELSVFNLLEAQLSQ